LPANAVAGAEEHDAEAADRIDSADSFDSGDSLDSGVPEAEFATDRTSTLPDSPADLPTAARREAALTAPQQLTPSGRRRSLQKIMRRAGIAPGQRPCFAGRVRVNGRPAQLGVGGSRSRRDRRGRHPLRRRARLLDAPSRAASHGSPRHPAGRQSWSCCRGIRRGSSRAASTSTPRPAAAHQ
jgi:hypothetical protein